MQAKVIPFEMVHSAKARRVENHDQRFGWRTPGSVARPAE
jgi:hypothetical protein